MRRSGSPMVVDLLSSNLYLFFAHRLSAQPGLVHSGDNQIERRAVVYVVATIRLCDANICSQATKAIHRKLRRHRSELEYWWCVEPGSIIESSFVDESIRMSFPWRRANESSMFNHRSRNRVVV